MPKVHVYPYWNPRDLRFLIKLSDPLFEADRNADHQGVEFWFSSSPDRPYPATEDFGLLVSIKDNIKRIHYTSRFNADGTFDIQRTYSDYPGTAHIQTSDFEGYRIDFGIPLPILGTPRPDSILCNIIVRAIDKNNAPILISWAPGTGNDAYCPALWGKLAFSPRPAHENFMIAGPLSFIAGFIVTILAGMLVSGAKKRGTTDRFEQSEDEKRNFAHICSMVDGIVTNKGLTLQLAAQKVSLSPQAVNHLLSRYAGLNFRNYVMRNRVELAKERLRSSHSSLSFIADTCGFKNVGEMEKSFRKFCKTTPYRFRKEFHVT